MIDEAEPKVRALPCWRGSVDIVPVQAGHCASAYKVKDAVEALYSAFQDRF